MELVVAMTLEQVQQLTEGIYRIHWNGGLHSMATIGIDDNAKTWIAPTNWCQPLLATDPKYLHWITRIDRVELLLEAFN